MTAKPTCRGFRPPAPTLPMRHWWWRRPACWAVGSNAWTLRTVRLRWLGEPREVNDESQLQGFLAHVSSPPRTLPVIALAHRPQTRFYGVDPRGLATAVRGLAHVICLDPAIATEVAEQLGPRLGVVPGAARIYSSKTPLTANPHDHPLLRNTRAVGNAQDSAGAFRRQLCQKICAMSVRAHGQIRTSDTPAAADRCAPHGAICRSNT